MSTSLTTGDGRTFLANRDGCSRQGAAVVHISELCSTGLGGTVGFGDAVWSTDDLAWSYCGRLFASLHDAMCHAATIVPLPDTPLYRAMRAGHRVRTGHDLVADLVGSPVAEIVRYCCTDGAS